LFIPRSVDYATSQNTYQNTLIMKVVIGLLLLTTGCAADKVETPVVTLDELEESIGMEFNKNFELVDHGPAFAGHGSGTGYHYKSGHKAEAPNFIFFVPDELRADVLGCYGGAAKTPNFDRLAKSGVRFEQTHVSNPVCAQSRAAFMTGWPTHVAGHRTLNSLLHKDEPNMLKYFKKNGYEVRWWGKNDVLASDSFRESVDTASSPGGSVRQGKQIGSKYSFLYEAFQGEEQTSDNVAVEEAIRFLKERQGQKGKPFVLFLPLGMPHPPYSAPQKFQALYEHLNSTKLRSHNLANKPEFHALIRKYHQFSKMSESEYNTMLSKVHQTYLAMVSYTDSLLGKLLDVVDGSKLKDNTAILTFSDHGDYAGDYGLVEKWPSGLEDVLTQVPLIARIPGVTEHNKGKTWKEPVQLFDVMPTVMEVAGIQVSHVHFAKSLVKPMMGTGDPKVDGRKYVFAEGGFASFEPRDLESDCDAAHKPCAPLGSNYYPKLLQQQERPESVARAIMVRSKTHKLIWRNDPEYGEKDCELYDLAKDPREENNKWDSPDYAGVKAELKDQLLHWLSQTSDVTPEMKDPRDSYPGVMQSPQQLYKKMPTLKQAPVAQSTPAKAESKKPAKKETKHGSKKHAFNSAESEESFVQKPGPVHMPYWR